MLYDVSMEYLPRSESWPNTEFAVLLMSAAPNPNPDPGYLTRDVPETYCFQQALCPHHY